MRISDWSSDVCSSDLKNERPPSTALQAFRTGFDKLTACSRGGGGEQVRSRLAALTPQHCPQLRGGGDDLVGDRFQLDVGEALRMRLQFDLDRQAELPVGDAGPREAVEQARIDDACLVGTADRANEVGGRQALGGEEGEVAAHRLQRRRCESRACRAARALRGNRRSEEHTSALQSLMRTSYAVFCLKRKRRNTDARGHTVRAG